MSRIPVATVLLGILAFGCRDKVPPPAPDSMQADDALVAKDAGDDAAASAAASSPATTKLVIEDIKVGKGPAAKAGDRVSVHYTGRLLDGSKFDSSLDRGQPFQFTLGQGMVIKGWDEGVVGMKKGGKRKLTIPPDLAYGKRGSPPKIPPDSTLTFDIELLDID